MSERTVTCPRCGEKVVVPTTGEKVRCAKCGQKFRFDTEMGRTDAEAEARSEAPEASSRPDAEEPPELPGETVACPRCGEMVVVPKTGEKVRCAKCRQKLRFDPKAHRTEDKDAAEAPPALPSPDLPSPALRPPVPEQSEEDEPATAQVSDELRMEVAELRELWPSLCGLIGEVYEEGRVTEADRLVFRTDAERAAKLAAKLLPRPEPAAQHGHEVVTSVLPKTNLDEVVALSLEDFRHLQHSLDEAQQLLDRHLPKPKEPSAPRPARPVAAQRPPQRGRGLMVAAGVLAFAAAVVAVVFTVPELRERVATRPALGALPGSGPAGASSEETGGVEQPRPATQTPKAPPSAPDSPTRPGTGVGPPVEPSAPVPRPSTKVAVGPVLPTRPDVVKRFHSRWRAGADGWIALFDGKGLDGWIGAGRGWQIKGKELRGIGTDGVAFLNVREAEWTDYCLAFKVMLGRTGSAVVSHGTLAVELEDRRVRVGYPQDGWRTLAQADKGLGRKKWYDIEFDVKGKSVELRIDGKKALASEGHAPLAGAPAIEAVAGGVAFRDIRLRLHESDPDYRAVALGEGYADDPRKPTPIAPSRPDEPPAVALRPGAHVLFNRRDFGGWRRVGAWTIRDGAMVARASAGSVAAAFVPGTAQARDYVLKVRCRLTRHTRTTREGEYLFLAFRQLDARNFYCVRFPIEGIFEIGRYRNGRFREVYRGVRRGDYNRPHDIVVTVRGNKLSMEVDGLGGLPTWPLRGCRTRGAIGIGVTGGEAAFADVRVRILR